MKVEKVEPLLSIEELADYLGIGKQTIYNWLHQKKISGIKIGKVWRFDRREIERWLMLCKINRSATIEL